MNFTVVNIEDLMRPEFINVLADAIAARLAHEPANLDVPLSRAELAERFQISVATVSKRVANGRIPSIQIGGRRVVTRRMLEKG